jgi:hypothetical protein
MYDQNQLAFRPTGNNSQGRQTGSEFTANNQKEDTSDMPIRRVL